MSFQLMAWAAQQTTGSGSRKAVLMALANAANHQTGNCYPSIEMIATETELSEPTVKRSLTDLEAQGLIARKRHRRGDGTLSRYSYWFPHQGSQRPGQGSSRSLPGITGDPDPGITVIPHNQEACENQEGNQEEHRARVKVQGRIVVATEHDFAEAILDTWNRVSGQRVHSDVWLRKIVLRIRAFPELDLDGHERIIEHAFAHPWWKNNPTPSVVYGSDEQFERSRLAAAGGSSTDRALLIAREEQRRMAS
jgi:hypothetical protein